MVVRMFGRRKTKAKCDATCVVMFHPSTPEQDMVCLDRLCRLPSNKSINSETCNAPSSKQNINFILVKLDSVYTRTEKKSIENTTVYRTHKKNYIGGCVRCMGFQSKGESSYT